ncbi:MAG TPA: ATP-binding protein [Streptosporangiaceae bacterium]
MPDEWPLRSVIELGALPGAVPCARLHTRQVLWEWGQTGLSEAAELVVSELVTNSVTATQSIHSEFPVRLWLLSDNSRVLILVADASPQPPKRIEAVDDTEGGRGLLLVEAVSSHWGWYATRQRGTAKVVWAELPRPPDSSQTKDPSDEMSAIPSPPGGSHG